MMRVDLGERCAQATVETAVVVPVLLVLALISYNLMVFLAATARFDRVAPDIVLAHGVAPAEAGGAPASSATACERITAELAGAMEGYDVSIEVTAEQGNGSGEVAGEESGEAPLLSLVGSLRTYRCVMGYEPWPQGFSIAGVPLGAPVALKHERPVTVDPWRPGVVM